MVGRTLAAPGHRTPCARANSSVIPSMSSPSLFFIAMNNAAVTRASPKALW
jgi:hypothetical protein